MKTSGSAIFCCQRFLYRNLGGQIAADTFSCGDACAAQMRSEYIKSNLTQIR